MKQTNLLLLVFAVFFPVCIIRAESEAKQTPPALSNILKAVARGEKEPIDHQDEFFNAWSFANHPNDSSTAILGVTLLWKNGQDTLLELVWWRQKDPEVRKCILLLYHAMMKTYSSDFPHFEIYAERFGKTEAEERKREITEVKKIAEECRPILQRAIVRK